jgi:hypothetical protein
MELNQINEYCREQDLPEYTAAELVPTWMIEEITHHLAWEALKLDRSQMTEVQQEMVQRWSELEALQTHYSEFADFLHDCMTELMGFSCSDIQVDIGDFLQYGIEESEEGRLRIRQGYLEPVRYGMIQAQRSQAKSTIVAIFAVWQLMQDPKHRVLIISAGSDVAMEIANWVIQIIMNWDILECMRPDRNHGDRASAKSFDVNWQLKGAEKSPSVACIGVTANMQGRRADLLVPDDIESSKNGTTEIQRQQLIHLSRDFTSICQKGRIMYLGTPQTIDSIYNTLPGRGYTIRIWPGRYPTELEEPCYGTHLAPLIANRMVANPSLRTGGGILMESGKPTDPMLLPESLLVGKELDQGPSYFQLQHMLNTALSDANRYPLKVPSLITMPLDLNKAPTNITWMNGPQQKIDFPGYNRETEIYRPFKVDGDAYDYESKYMYVDTAGGGQNGDETVAWVIAFLHGYIFCLEMLPLEGGYEDSVFEKLSALAFKHQVNEIGVEMNHGYGSFAQMWRPVMMKYYKEQGKPGCPKIDDDWVTTQKETRIVDTLEPFFARHRIVFNTDIWQTDLETVSQYPLDERTVYTLYNQISRITKEKGCLIHDDRIDGLAGAVRRYVDNAAIDDEIKRAQDTSSENLKMMAEWSDDFGKSLTKGLGTMIHTGRHSARRKRNGFR